MTIGVDVERPASGIGPKKRDRDAIMMRLIATRPAVAPALLRVVLAVVIFPHGAQHLLGWFGGYGFAGTYGWMTGTLGIPGILAVVAIVTEFVAPLALLVGFGSRAAALGIMGLLAVAASTHAANGFFMNWTGSLPAGAEGYEYHVLAIVMALAVVIQGSGAWSVDRMLAAGRGSFGLGGRRSAGGRTRGAAALALAALLVLSACSGPSAPEDPPAVAAVELGERAVDLPVGATHQLSATLKAADGRALSGRPIHWSSGDTLVATVTSTGLVAARRAGRATITATSEGRSDTATIAVMNPLPAPTGLSPASAAAGGSDFVLTVTGTGFVAGSHVTWNGVERPTMYLSGGELRVEIPAADLGVAGEAVIGVTNPLPGGGSSATLPFVIRPAEAWHPVPEIASVTPSALDLGAATQLLQVSGSGFVGASVVRVNGTSRPTELLDNGALRVTITATDVALVGSLTVTVFNPAPGGGTSGPVTVRVRPCCYDLLYEARVAGRQEMLTFRSGTVGPIRLLANVTARDPSPSPDGTRIAYVGEDTAGNVDIYVVDVSTRTIQQLTSAGTIEDQPAWSPDGQRIAYRTLVGERSGIMVAYETAPGVWLHSARSPHNVNEQRPAWSPDGQRLAFSSDAAGTADIWTMRADGTDRRRITSSSLEETEPTWSPDGLLIAYAQIGTGGSASVRVAASGAGWVMINQPLLGEGRLPEWSPLGDWIAYTVRVNGRDEVAIMRADGTERQVHTADPAWGGGTNATWIRTHR